MRKNFGKKTWFYPLPALIIGSYDEDGRADAMNAAWGGIYDADKIVLCLGEIVNVNADERILGEDGMIDAGKLKAISFGLVHNAYVKMGEKVGNAFADGAVLK